jgi:nicotinate-nucleotide adenylyltransferase
VLQILTWKEPDQVLAQAEFIAATRPGFDLERLVSQVPGAAGRVHRIDIPALAISSSDIRSRVARGAPIQYLVPDGVARYIQNHALYRAPAGDQTPGRPAGHGTQ